ncbi:uncharacterized protein LOC124451283 [Xenia sp. Carnegie-2017]|uniref:uncharacterized protein LOC124451283 n=1 Tax=Xenia sp. Carnegie-2017 TaxID=2897299 RepID=UPI001F04C65A|nr:uncharacterized protein LOC124451283 [Xenia sp. Carnegie-2017]
MKRLNDKNEVDSSDSSSRDKALIKSEEDPHNVPMLPLVVPNRPIAERSYKFIGNVPQDLSALSVVAVADILRGLKMGQYANIFEMELIDGIMLMKLTDSDLKSFNMSPNQRLKLMGFIKGWRPRLKLTEQGKTRNPVISSSDKEVFSFENEQSTGKEKISDGGRLEDMDIGQDADIFEEEIVDGVLVKDQQTTSLRTKATRLINRNDSLYEQEFNFKSQFLDERYNIKKDVHEKFKSLSWICGNYGTVIKNKVISYPHLYITVDGYEERSDEDLKNQIDQTFEWEASKFIEIRRKPYKNPKIRYLSNLPDVRKYVNDFGEKSFAFNLNRANGELYKRIEIREETVKVRINNHSMGFIIERCFSHLTKYTNVDKEETEREVIFQNAVKMKSDSQFLKNSDSDRLVYFLDKQENWQPFAYVLCEIEDDDDGDEKEDNDFMKCKNRPLKTFICLKLDEA